MSGCGRTWNSSVWAPKTFLAFLKVFIYLLPVSGLSCNNWDLSFSSRSWSATGGILVLQPGTEPRSPALEGGFFFYIYDFFN